MKHWRMDDVDWGRFDAAKVDPAVIPLVKAAAMVSLGARAFVSKEQLADLVPTIRAVLG